MTCCSPSARAEGARSVALTSGTSTRGQVLVPGGEFAMGDAFDEGYPEDGETPVHQVTLADFHLDATAVTNAQFAAFVDATGHTTDAEELGVSAVFHLAFEGPADDLVDRVDGAPWWWVVRGADWRHPNGRWSEALADHPVVHVSWYDATRYAAWAGKRLPTEAEWEYAARGGLAGRRFCWGDELTADGRWHTNIWQGEFPTENSLLDGFLTTAPVRSYEPNGYGAWQLTGNAWEWCADWFSADYYAVSPAGDPRGPASGERRVMRGGSYLCHASYCHRYRVSARSGNTPSSASANLGFRCANDTLPGSPSEWDASHSASRPSVASLKTGASSPRAS